MSLLEKASGELKSASSSHQSRSSLFRRAMAASQEEASEDAEPAAAPPAAPLPAPAEEAQPIIDLDVADELKDKLQSLPPFHDSVFAAWSLLADRLPLQALALLLPRGDFLIPAARFGFPTVRNDEIPATLADPALGHGELLSSEARALVAPALGVEEGTMLRAVPGMAGSQLAGLWIFHDDRFESATGESRRGLVALLAEAFSSLSPFAMSETNPDPARFILSRLNKHRFATALRFDLGSAYTDSPTCRGVSTQALVSAFVLASGRILEQTGLALSFGTASFAGVLGTSSRIDPELSLFQFAKTLKRSLPFLSSGAFPSGKAACSDLSSDGALAELSRFLAD